MENLHPYIILIAGLVPLFVGFVWYHKATFGNAWMVAASVNLDTEKKPNMALIFGLTYLFSCFIGVILSAIVIHQFGFFSMVADLPGVNDPNSENGQMVKHMMDLYGQNFRTFKHGAFHGVLTGIMFSMPVLAINALFERKNAKYILINAGFWVVCLALMGGIICAFL
jgi:hypothetical protein